MKVLFLYRASSPLLSFLLLRLLGSALATFSRASQLYRLQSPYRLESPNSWARGPRTFYCTFVHTSPRSRLESPNSWLRAPRTFYCTFVHTWPRSRLESPNSWHGPRGVSVKYLLLFFSRLRRGDFRYTRIFFQCVVHLKKIRASGEAILGTLKYISMCFTLEQMFAPPARF